MTRRTSTWRVSGQLLWFHRGRYGGLALVVLVTTVLGIAELLLLRSLTSGHVADAGSRDDASAHDLASQVDEISTLLTVMLVLTVGIALMLAASSMSAVLDSRRSELALLRLNGASRLQLRWLLARESAMLGLAVGAVGGLVGTLFVPVLFGMYKRLGAFGETLELTRYADLPAAVLFVMLLAVVLGSVGFYQAGSVDIDRRSRRQHALTKVTSFAIGLARLAMLGGSVALVLSLGQGAPEAGQIAVLAPAAVTLGLIAIAVYIIPALMCVLGRALTWLHPGIFTLIAARAFGDRRRLAAVATPMLLAVGLLGGFIYSTGADAIIQRTAYLSRTDYETRIQTTDHAEALSYAAASPSRTVIMGEPRSVTVDGREALSVAVSDTGALVRLLGGESTSRSRVTVGHQTDVLSSVPGETAGSTVAVRTAEGRRISYRIAETAAALPLEAYWIPLSADADADPDASDAEVWTIYTSDPASQVDRSGFFREGAIIESKEQVAVAHERAREATSMRGNISVFGTIYVMAVVALVQACVLTTSRRQGEFATLTRIGMSAPSILGGIVAEAMLLCISTAIPLFAAFYILALKFSSDLGVDTVQAYASSTPPVLIVQGALSALLVGLVFIAGMRTMRRNHA